MNNLAPVLSKAEIGSISTLGLAYVGDGVYELLVRTWLLTHHHTASLDLHRACVAVVNAPAQARASGSRARYHRGVPYRHRVGGALRLALCQRQHAAHFRTV